MFYLSKKARNFWSLLTSFREATVFITIIIFSAILTFLSPHFFTIGNIRTTAIGMSADGIMAIGMTIALVSGGFDLAVGSIFALSGVVTGMLYLAGINIWIAVLIGIIASVLCGLISGILIGKVKLNPLIVTLGMMGIARGIVYILTKSSPQSLRNMPNLFSQIGRGSVFGIPIIVIIFIVLTILADYLMRNSSILRKVFYTGSNEKAAKLSGINVEKIKIGVYMSTAFLAGIAGIITLSRFGVANPTAGVGSELRVISAAVIGGASLEGGEGTVYGAVLGVILLGIINNSLVLLGVSVYWQELISGLILILAVTIDHLSQVRKKKQLKKLGK